MSAWLIVVNMHTPYVYKARRSVIYQTSFMFVVAPREHNVRYHKLRFLPVP